MIHQNTICYMRPKDIEPTLARKVLSFLNRANTAQEISDAIRSAGERTIGIRVAHNILSERERLGRFVNLRQVTIVPTVGASRFTRIVNAVETIKI